MANKGQDRRRYLTQRYFAKLKMPNSYATHGSLADAFSVYLRRPVLIVMLLGFSSGLPLALAGSTLLIRLRQAGVDLSTISLFALVNTPYTIKFLWSPVIDAVNVPWLSRLVGRRRAWVLLSQVLLISSIALLAETNPAANLWPVAFSALLVTTASATQDVVIDAFRIESLQQSEQAAGSACYVAGYRIGIVVSTSGALFLISAFKSLGFVAPDAWRAGYATMGSLVIVGIVSTLIATEPESSIPAADYSQHNVLRRVVQTTVDSFQDLLKLDQVIIVFAFLMLFKLTNALTSVMAAVFVLDLSFSDMEYASIVNPVGLAATIAGGFLGGFIGRAYTLDRSLWIGGGLQAAGALAFCWQAIVGHNIPWLAVTVAIVSFTSGIGTVIFVAYLAALCFNPRHTAAQYALLDALTSVARTYLSSGAGYLATHTGWIAFFANCAVAAIPSLALLAVLQRGGHFRALLDKKEQFRKD
jgi:MFS transporter, PAT family, beta-lactamase induction signal transducer AmpG